MRALCKDWTEGTPVGKTGGKVASGPLFSNSSEAPRGTFEKSTTMAVSRGRQDFRERRGKSRPFSGVDLDCPGSACWERAGKSS